MPFNTTFVTIVTAVPLVTRWGESDSAGAGAVRMGSPGLNCLYERQEYSVLLMEICSGSFLILSLEGDKRILGFSHSPYPKCGVMKWRFRSAA